MKQPVDRLRVIDWLALASVVLLLLGKVLSAFNLGDPELLSLIEEDIGRLNNLALALSFTGLSLNFFRIQKNKQNVLEVLRLTSFWSFVLSLVSLLFF